MSKYLKTSSFGYIPKKQLVQLRNPRRRGYVVVDTVMGCIVAHHPRKETPYKDIIIKK